MREERLTKYGETGRAEPLLRKTPSLSINQSRSGGFPARLPSRALWDLWTVWLLAPGNWVKLFHCNTSDNFHIKTADKRRMSIPRSAVTTPEDSSGLSVADYFSEKVKASDVILVPPIFEPSGDPNRASGEEVTNIYEV